MDKLVAPRTTPFAANIGSSQHQGRPPWPRRRTALNRPPILDSPVEQHKGTRDDARFLDDEAIERVNEFVHGTILKGRAEANLDGVVLEDFEAFRTLVEAVKDSPLILDDPRARRFTFTVQDRRGTPADFLAIIRWATREGTFEGLDLTFRAREVK
jgi:hypothetical protein